MFLSYVWQITRKLALPKITLLCDFKRYLKYYSNKYRCFFCYIIYQLLVSNDSLVNQLNKYKLVKSEKVM